MQCVCEREREYECVFLPWCREELVEQAEDMQEMYEKRMKLLQKSMKKQFSRKRRRVETEEEGEREGEGGVERKEGAVEVHRREKVSELEEQLQEERERGEQVTILLNTSSHLSISL